MNIWNSLRAPAVATAAGGALMLAATAAGGSAGHWSTIASGSGLRGAAQEIGLARTSDGTLHVAWRDDSGTSALIHTRSISASGQLGPTLTAVSRAAVPSDPALAPGLRVCSSISRPAPARRSRASPLA